uniref:Uncharacterized protein n=1 Tax=Micrurus carvalhoi TaxID=3147026 RepID=A0A2H6NE93_9SAUR
MENVTENLLLFHDDVLNSFFVFSSALFRLSLVWIILMIFFSHENKAAKSIIIRSGCSSNRNLFQNVEKIKSCCFQVSKEANRDLFYINFWLKNRCGLKIT